MELALQFMRSLGNGKLFEFNFSMGMIITLLDLRTSRLYGPHFQLRTLGIVMREMESVKIAVIFHIYIGSNWTCFCTKFT